MKNSYEKLNQSLQKSFDKEKHESCSGWAAASADDDDDTEDGDNFMKYKYANLMMT